MAGDKVPEKLPWPVKRAISSDGRRIRLDTPARTRDEALAALRQVLDSESADGAPDGTDGSAGGPERPSGEDDGE